MESLMNQSRLTCGTCPGADKCYLAEAEFLLNELRKDKIRQEIRDCLWILSLPSDDAGLSSKQTRDISVLLSKLRRILFAGSTDALCLVSELLAERDHPIAFRPPLG